MERYSEYKSSVIPGLTEIPSHWNEILNGILFKDDVRKPQSGDSPLSLSQKDGLIPTDMMKESSLKTSSYDNWKRVLKDDLVLNRFKAHLGVLMASNYEGMVSFHYGVYKPQLPLKTKYYEYLYHTDVYKGIYAYSSKGMTVGLQNLSNLSFYSIKGLYPPLAEQEKIVSYLNSKTSIIDAYVAERERELRLLNELKETEIANVVTQGLNPNVKMKDSGIPWIGMIPEHWELRRIKYILKELKEKSESGLETPLSLSKEDGIIPFDEKKNRTMESASYVGGKIVHKGEIVFNRFKARLFAISQYDGIVSSDYAVYECRETASPEYLVKLFSTEMYREAFNRKASGIGDGFSRLYTDDLFAMYAIFPPLTEQRAIVAHIENKCSKVNSLISELEAEIEYLKEYKQRLIADCVTGQVNVQQT